MHETINWTKYMGKFGSLLSPKTVKRYTTVKFNDYNINDDNFFRTLTSLHKEREIFAICWWHVYILTSAKCYSSFNVKFLWNHSCENVDSYFKIMDKYYLFLFFFSLEIVKNVDFKINSLNGSGFSDSFFHVILISILSILTYSFSCFLSCFFFQVYDVYQLLENCKTRNCLFFVIFSLELNSGNVFIL